MRCVYLAFSVVSLASGLNCKAVAAPGDRFDCIVYNFQTADKSDPSFIEENMRKTFHIVENETSISVASRSSKFDDSASEFQILQNELGVTFGVDLSFVPSTIALSTTPSEDKGADAEATIVLLGSFMANAWYLRCQKAE
jgi:hypothetical protein